MLPGVVPFPPEFAARYRAKGYWQDRTLAQEFAPVFERFADRIARACHVGPASRAVDLVIRSGGERRLSDFLLWESAYAELWFTKRFWPDFRGADLARAVRWFHARERRFGGLPEHRAVTA